VPWPGSSCKAGKTVPHSRPIDRHRLFWSGFSLTPLNCSAARDARQRRQSWSALTSTRGLPLGRCLGWSRRPGEGSSCCDPPSRQVMGWMETVVEASSGTASRWGLSDRRQGRAQRQKALNGATSPEPGSCSFVQALPIDDPRYVVLVVVDEPQGAMPTAPPWLMPAPGKSLELSLVSRSAASSRRSGMITRRWPAPTWLSEGFLTDAFAPWPTCLNQLAGMTWCRDHRRTRSIKQFIPRTRDHQPVPDYWRQAQIPLYQG